MRIFIEIPAWLGDCVMATPAVENILKTYAKAKITIFGSKVASNVFVNHPSVENIIIDTSKNNGFRYFNLYKLVRNLPQFDLALSFRRNFTTKFLLFFVNSMQKYHYQRYTKKQKHQVICYNDFINKSLNLNTIPAELRIYLSKNTVKKNILGINPGATYGSAKRWYADKFVEVVNSVADNFDEVIIFGGDGEKDIAFDIEKNLKITNYKNIAGKLTVVELFENISTLNTFITADSGPMHVAAAFGIKTTALFGSTKDAETSPWHNENATIIRQNKEILECAPCMNRVCKLKHHKCMKNITPQQIIDVFAITPCSK